MTLIALVLLAIALANGMEAQTFIDVIEGGDGGGALLFIVAAIIAFIGDLRRMG